MGVSFELQFEAEVRADVGSFISDKFECLDEVQFFEFDEVGENECC
jgi:hypothetical protein